MAPKISCKTTPFLANISSLLHLHFFFHRFSVCLILKRIKSSNLSCLLLTADMLVFEIVLQTFFRWGLREFQLVGKFSISKRDREGIGSNRVEVSPKFHRLNNIGKLDRKVRKIFESDSFSETFFEYDFSTLLVSIIFTT